MDAICAVSKIFLGEKCLMVTIHWPNKIQNQWEGGGFTSFITLWDWWLELSAGRRW
jgi:hypothetical protein